MPGLPRCAGNWGRELCPGGCSVTLPPCESPASLACAQTAQDTGWPGQAPVTQQGPPLEALDIGPRKAWSEPRRVLGVLCEKPYDSRVSSCDHGALRRVF